MNICVFGDSIAYGTYDLERGGWANRLRLYLDETGFDRNLYNLGVSGDNSGEILKRFESEALARTPGVIIFAFGINDSKYLIDKNQNKTSLDEFIENTRSIISKAKTITKDIIFVGLTAVDENGVNPTPWDANMMYSNLFIEKYNKVIEIICKEEKIKFINLFNDMIKLDYKEMLTDGLHPDPKGHQWIAEKVVKALNL